MIKDLAYKLKTLRTQYSYSQKEVADRLGISASIISGYETGERTPSTENLLALSNLYKCSTDYLLGKSKEAPPPPPPPPPLPNSYLDTTGLSEKQLKALSAFIDTMKHPD